MPSIRRDAPGRGINVIVTASRIVFVSREPVVHQLGGSTTYSLNLLGVLRESGAEVTVVTTSAFSRSPLLWFRTPATLPAGVTLESPGFVRIGGLYLAVSSPAAWARAISRFSTRWRGFRPLGALVERLFGDRLYSNAWDLTAPTPRECRVAMDAIRKHDATTVITNYAFWAPLLQAPELAGRKRVILMHDLLSSRVKLFLDSGTPLDCPVIEEEEEMRWLNSADCVLAAQAREAETIQPRLNAKVLVQPMVYRPQRPAGTPEPGRCLFVGSNIVPNQTGLRWFVDEVWPLVRAAAPQATLAVVGTICSWLEDGIPGVVKMNSVPSIEREYARATVCVAPLRIGSGIKIKLIEALSFGKAAVATSIGVQGLEQWADGAIDVHDDAQGFAASVVRLLVDAAERVAHEEAALRLIQEHYSADALLDSQFSSCVLGAAD